MQAVHACLSTGDLDAVEHLHYYSGGEDGETVMEPHTDAGYMIAMTSGGVGDDYTLLIGDEGEEEPLGAVGELVVMAGDQGATSMGWKPVRHAVQGSSSDRGWYGVMYFEKGTANLEEVQGAIRDGKEGVAVNGILQDGGDCGDDAIYCWQQCVSTSDVQWPTGCAAEDALCADPDGVIVPFPNSRDDMTMDYQVLCASNVNGYDGSSSPVTSNGFCSGAGTDMFMDGFQFVFGGDSLCLNFLLPSALLDSKLKFTLALLGSITLGFSVEVLTSYRRNVFRKMREQGRKAKMELTLLHGAQALIGYILMCLAMSFSLEVLFCVVLGLMIGHYIFNAEEIPREKADPCCNDDFNYDDIADDDDSVRDSSLYKRKSSSTGGKGAAQPLMGGV